MAHDCALGLRHGDVHAREGGRWWSPRHGGSGEILIAVGAAHPAVEGLSLEGHAGPHSAFSYV